MFAEVTCWWRHLCEESYSLISNPNTNSAIKKMRFGLGMLQTYENTDIRTKVTGKSYTKEKAWKTRT